MTPAGAPAVFVIVDDAPVVFLAAGSSRYVTGQTLLVDGGFSTGATHALASSAPYKPAESS
jgi:NAD(P)-dependent dehydrogenase (short-subunit alcohol dehydrogenase family)